MFSLIVAVGKNNEIGKNNQLLWHIPEDLKNFKRITTGKTVIMGRNTYESIGRPLPNRVNIVLSRNFLETEKKINKDRKKYENETTKLEFFDDFQKVAEKYKDLPEEVFIIGGGEIYKKSLELGIIKRIYMSHIDFSDSEADAYFPEIDLGKWVTLTEENYDGWKFCIYENHIEGLKEQLTRKPLKLAKIKITDKPFNELTFEDITLEDYESYPAIKFEVAV